LRPGSPPQSMLLPNFMFNYSSVPLYAFMCDIRN